MKKKVLILIILGVLILLNIFAWDRAFDHSAELEVNFFDVGQGDAIFIETPAGYQVLIDGGPSGVVLDKLAKEMPLGDRTIDLMILTHPEHDHYGGLIEVLEQYQVDNILWTGIVRETAEFKKWQELIEKEGAEIIIAQEGQRIIFKTAYLEVLHPFKNLEGQTSKSVNNTSIVFRLVFQDNSFLFTGDAFKAVEKELIAKNELKVDVLKVGHHGSKTSSAEEFIQAVSPEIAIISCGLGNSYGHPNEEVLAVLEKFAIRILRTDEDGDIKIVGDGKELQIIK